MRSARDDALEQRPEFRTPAHPSFLAGPVSRTLAARTPRQERVDDSQYHVGTSDNDCACRDADEPEEATHEARASPVIDTGAGSDEADSSTMTKKYRARRS
jgi:hypothetical protein